jgi:hypothetical protein
VEKEGVLNTTVTLTGSSQVALARNPQTRQANAAVRRPPASEYGDVAGNPTALAPQQVAPNQYAPQYAPQQVQRSDDGYIYPADGSSDAARYPAPRGSRRVYDAQSYPQQQQYYDNRGYYAPPQVYAPRPYYRGLFD